MAEGQRDESVNGVNHMAAHCGCFVLLLWVMVVGLFMLWVCGLCRAGGLALLRVAGRGVVGIKKVIFEIAC